MKKYLSYIVLGAALALSLSAVVVYADGLSLSMSTPTANQNVPVNQMITFNAEASGGDSSHYGYLWNFGDGTVGAGASYDKAYSVAGVKTVSVTVTDGAGAQATISRDITVTGAASTDPLVITDLRITDVTTNSVVVHWKTNRVADSRVIFDTTSHPSITGQTGPNYGYANSTGTSDASPKVIEHSVTVTGLSANTTYYFRAISQE
jgi:hypothetical protein